MAEREWMVRFDADGKANVALVAGRAPSVLIAYPFVDAEKQYHVFAPDSRRAELIARAMRKKP